MKKLIFTAISIIIANFGNAQTNNLEGTFTAQTSFEPNNSIQFTIVNQPGGVVQITTVDLPNQAEGFKTYYSSGITLNALKEFVIPSTGTWFIVPLSGNQAPYIANVGGTYTFVCNCGGMDNNSAGCEKVESGNTIGCLPTKDNPCSSCCSGSLVGTGSVTAGSFIIVNASHINFNGQIY